MSELIITNGDMAADLMRQAGLDADVLPWRDVLHEGPVEHASCLEDLSRRRATFLAEAFDMTESQAIADMEKRDRTLREAARHDSITLWFEHDLYDQLQLLQILDFFHREAGFLGLELVQTDDHLGAQTADGIRSFAEKRVPVSFEQKALAADIFAAFRNDTPVELAGFLNRDLTVLPHMKAALKRLFEELPDAGDGLSRTQRQVLAVIARESPSPSRLFAAVQAMEEAMFMGDLSCWRCLEEMVFNTCPLIDGLPCRFSMIRTDGDHRDYLNAPLTLTGTGRTVLDGQADHAVINRIDRWLGGTRIETGTIWRWDRGGNRLVAPT